MVGEYIIFLLYYQISKIYILDYYIILIIKWKREEYEYLKYQNKCKKEKENYLFKLNII